MRPSTRVLPDRPLAGLVVCLVDSDIRSVTLVSIVRPCAEKCRMAAVIASTGRQQKGLERLRGKVLKD